LKVRAKFDLLTMLPTASTVRGGLVSRHIDHPQTWSGTGSPQLPVLSYGADEMTSGDPVLALVILAIITYAVFCKKP
jgi:hypothetical protein